jgi:hypothetical protein
VQEEMKELYGDEGTTSPWSDVVGDLWEKHLPHFREEFHVEGLFVYSPTPDFRESEDAHDTNFETALLSLEGLDSTSMGNSTELTPQDIPREQENRGKPPKASATPQPGKSIMVKES